MYKTIEFHSHLLCIVPFLFKDLLICWLEFSNYVVYDIYFVNNYVCRNTECYTKTELCKASNYILAQILSSEKSRCAVQKRVGFSSLHTARVHQYSYKVKQLHQESGSLAGQPDSFRTDTTTGLQRSGHTAGHRVKPYVLRSMATWDSHSCAAFFLVVSVCRLYRSNVPAQGSVLSVLPETAFDRAQT